MKCQHFLILLLLSLSSGLAAQDTVRLSAAMQRFQGDDSENEFYTRFRYQPVNGLGYENGVNRRDASSIIKVGDVYYVWYTRNRDSRYSWLNADIWYATSTDGINWTEMGPAVERGPKGSWDDFSVFTTNILVTEGKYYLTYQARTFTEQRNVIGMAKADSPDGPWQKLPDPILRTTPDGKYRDEHKPGYSNWQDFIEEGSWDSGAVHDPGILIRKGKYWLYYKGHKIGEKMFADSKIGVAVSDYPEGPYEKHTLNPVLNSGHEVWMWPYKSGVASLVDWAGPEKGTVQYTEDGVNFEVMTALEDIPPAGGAYIADKFDDPEDGQGFTWGICHYGMSDWNFLLRFDCDMKQGVQKKISWNYFQHYSTVRDVMADPGRFQLPVDALDGIKTAINGIQTENHSLSIYPNPASEYIIIGLDKPSVVMIHDIRGTLLLTRKCLPGEVVLSLDTFPSGLYLLRVGTHNEIMAEKFVVKN